MPRMDESSNGRGTRFEPPKYRERKKLDLVGSAEAAIILNVEKPRIGRFIKRGIMPPQAINTDDDGLFPDRDGEPRRLAAGPVWYRADIEKLRDAREKAGLRRSREEPAGV